MVNNDNERNAGSVSTEPQTKLTTEFYRLVQENRQIQSDNSETLSQNKTSEIFDKIEKVSDQLVRTNIAEAEAQLKKFYTEFAVELSELVRNQTDVVAELEEALTLSQVVALDVIKETFVGESMPDRVSFAKLGDDTAGTHSDLRDLIKLNPFEKLSPAYNALFISDGGLVGIGTTLLHEVMHRYQRPVKEKIKQIFLGVFPAFLKFFIAATEATSHLPPQIDAAALGLILAGALNYKRHLQRDEAANPLYESQAFVAQLSLSRAIGIINIDQDDDYTEYFEQKLIDYLLGPSADKSYHFSKHPERLQQATKLIVQMRSLGISQQEIASHIRNAKWEQQKGTYSSVEAFIDKQRQARNFSVVDMDILRKIWLAKRTRRILKIRIAATQLLEKKLAEVFP